MTLRTPSRRSRTRLALGLAALGAGAGSTSYSSPALAKDPAPAEPPPIDVRQARPPDGELTYRPVRPNLSFTWFVFQLIPNPELVFGREREVDGFDHVDKSVKTNFGLRWELTPFLWSFGVHRKQTHWRTLIVDPVARYSGSIELDTTIEYIASSDISGLILRPGVRGYIPLAQRGEYLSMSLGTSTYRHDGFRVAYDVGLYTLSGFLGILVTAAPAHAPLTTIATLRLRVF